MGKTWMGFLTAKYGKEQGKGQRRKDPAYQF
jgi:hypothetical protein